MTAAPKRTEIQDASSSFQGCGVGDAACARRTAVPPTPPTISNAMKSARATLVHARYFSKEKIRFQSFFMLITVQPFFFASS